VYGFGMSLTEIETAVQQLSMPEQEELLRHLEETLRRKRSASSPESREAWMHRLQTLRASVSTGTQSLSSEQILADLRED
jgi:hypothetical protein